MRAIEAKHLIIGGGVLGLATADHLLRRGAEGVVVVESGSTPGQVRHGVPGLVLSSGILSNAEIESRGHLLLEDWPTYLEIDPHFRRAGSVVLPSPSSLPSGWESVPAGDARLRSVSGDSPAVFAARDGLLDATELLGALHWRVRRLGGRIVTDCSIESLQRRDVGVAFSGSSREGIAERVYLTAGSATPGLARTLGVSLPLRHVRWQEMRLIGPPGEFGIVRLRRDVDNDVEDHGLLEIEHDVPSNSEPSTDTEIVLFREDGTIDLSLIRPCGPKSADITVDWSLWEDVRRDLSAILPTLGVARVRSARAEAILALEPETVTVRVELDGQLLVGGGCGLSGLLLAPALAERLAEAGLA